jgi:rare lipoprotein A
MKLINKFIRLKKKKLIFLIMFFVISGCSEATFLVNSAKRIGTWGDEPTYKVGNPYKINGKWYYPAIDYDYDETGYASWYGPGFHGKKTANGEIFDQNKISAAHRTLPLPSIVKVTNLENGKFLESVRVNDRGPFARDRILDLSKEAAKELGFVNKGVTKVRVEILEDESRKFANDLIDDNNKTEAAVVQKISKKEITVQPTVNENNFAENNEEVSDKNFILDNNVLIQVGAFTDHRNAKSLTEKLSEFKAFIKREFINNQYFYRVRIGPMENISIANELKEKLFNLGYTSSHIIMR